MFLGLGGKIRKTPMRKIFVGKGKGGSEGLAELS